MQFLFLLGLHFFMAGADLFFQDGLVLRLELSPTFVLMFGCLDIGAGLGGNS